MATAEQQNFIQSIWAEIQQSVQGTNINPLLPAAQAVLETGWGQSAPQNNYFGIKGSGSSELTTEYVNGVPTTVPQNFAGYSSFSDSLQGWVNLITGSPRYSAVASSTDPSTQAQALAQAGYATDPNYADKLQGVMASIQSIVSGGGMSTDTQPIGERVHRRV